ERDVGDHVRHAGDRHAVRRGRGGPVRLDAERGDRQDERGRVPPSGERPDPRPAPPEDGGGDGEVRGTGDPPAEGRRSVPRDPQRLPGDTRWEAGGVHGPHAAPWAGGEAVARGPSMAATSFTAETSVIVCDMQGTVQK